ncbi:MAG: hypothetical protein IKO41_06625 [Lachnospiraceae bacterium]|nr:hypothetical protein [Lachnospiraceae bacterium]MBR4605887.1 hypothetical protein [Lachnospiraceae bacterium]
MIRRRGASTGCDAAKLLDKGEYMNKNEFAEEVRKNLAESFGEEMEVKLQKVKKNNGITLLGIMVNDKKRNIAPTLYLDDLYEEFQNGRAFEEILGVVRENLKRGMPKGKIDMDFFMEFEKVKEKICYRLVNQERNAQMLEKVPNIPFLDLAITFFYVFWNDEIGGGSIAITNTHLEKWGTSVAELWKVANDNTRRIYPEQCCPMEELLFELMGRHTKIWPALPEECSWGPFSMKILTNHTRNNGSAVILYDGYLERLAEKLESGFYILPSSVHEVIMFPKIQEYGEDFLKEMVRESNEHVVDPQEFLSDSVYYYDRDQKKIELVNP